MSRTVKSSLAACLVLSTVAACHEPVLTARPEDEANRAMAVLVTTGVKARKVVASRGAFSVLVPRSELDLALEALGSASLPRLDEPTLAHLFPEQSLISTPHEEMARFQLGVATDLAGSLRKIPGVRDARVHLGMSRSENRRLDRSTREPPRASVLLLVEARYVETTHRHLASIQGLVAGAIPALEASAVSVFVAEAPPLPTAKRDDNQGLPLSVVLLLIMGSASIAAGLTLLSILLLRKHLKARRHNEAQSTSLSS